MDPLLTKEESYAERRELFKNIWEAAMHAYGNEPDVMNKPKVIKTLRLDEVDKCVTGKRKKQRIKNLRTVCNKILDFCDRHDADDRIYKQIAATDRVPLHGKLEVKRKKTKPVRIKKMVKKVKSMLIRPNGSNQAQVIATEKRDVILKDKTNKTSRTASPMKIKVTPVLKNPLVNKVV